MALITALSGCADSTYRQPISVPPLGAAVRANLAAQIVDPPRRADGPARMDAARAVLGIEHYRTGDGDTPHSVSTSSAVGASPSG